MKNQKNQRIDSLIERLKIKTSAKTFAGKIKAIKKSKKIGVRELNPEYFYNWGRAEKIEKYKTKEIQRTKFPNGKRCLSNKRFKSNYLRKINRKIKKIMKPIEEKNLVAYSRHEENINGVKTNLERLLEEKSFILGKKIEMNTSNFVKINLSENLGKKQFKCCTRGKDWAILPTFKKSYFRHFEGETKWRGGRIVGYTRAVNDNFVRSFGVLINEKRINYIIHESEYSLQIKNEDFIFDRDEYGLKICFENSRQDDFHFDADDLLDGEEHLISICTENREDRLRLKAMKMAEMAELEGIKVC